MEKAKKIKLVFGIGNPGPEYEGTRHNFGLDLVRHQLQAERPFPLGSYGKRDRLILASANTFVNESGKAVKLLQQLVKCKPEEILVVHDEADLPFLWLKLSFARSAAGHKGVESIIRALKTDKFWRLRLGIQGTPGQDPRRIKRKQAMDIILKKLRGPELDAWKRARRRFGQILDRLGEVSPDKLNFSQQFLVE